MNRLSMAAVCLGVCLISCGENSQAVANQPESVELPSQELEIEQDVKPFISKEPIFINRDSIVKRLKSKIKKQKALVVHALVPLCDNEHQGIVPVAKHLGRGRDLKGNLYWGCGHGMKAYFKNRHGWKHVRSDSLDGEIILERSVFRKTYANGAKVYLVCDAYAGEKMQTCLKNYLAYLAGEFPATMVLGKDTIGIRGDADMIVFNGHNGLMDGTVSKHHVKQSAQKDAMAIACYSHAYFNSYYASVGAYPLVNTNGLLYPGAFIVSDVIDSWAQLKDAEACKVSAGEAYNREMKCGRRAGIGLFKAGW